MVSFCRAGTADGGFEGGGGGAVGALGAVVWGGLGAKGAAIGGGGGGEGAAGGGGGATPGDVLPKAALRAACAASESPFVEVMGGPGGG